jgi:hypothetical protein
VFLYLVHREQICAPNRVQLMEQSHKRLERERPEGRELPLATIRRIEHHSAVQALRERLRELAKDGSPQIPRRPLRILLASASICGTTDRDNSTRRAKNQGSLAGPSQPAQLAGRA